MVAFGTVLKPENNVVAMYKLVAGLNEATYIQMDYRMVSIYWHHIFDKVLLYMLNRLCVGRVE